MCSGTEEGRGKGRAPKESGSRRPFSWAYGEEPYDCHRDAMESYLEKEILHILWGCLSTVLFYAQTRARKSAAVAARGSRSEQGEKLSRSISDPRGSRSEQGEKLSRSISETRHQ